MSRLFVQLGRNGDILNILPLLWDEAQRSERPRLMVAKAYAGLLDGVSYVEPVIFEGEAFDLAPALKIAAALDPDYICTQTNGPTEFVRDLVYKRAGQTTAITTSYQKEMWKLAGKLPAWGAQITMPLAQFPLVFDKRDKKREAAMMKPFEKALKRKTILVCHTGISSPFEYRSLLVELLRLAGCSVIDISAIKAERFYDLLGLYERADALVSIDSAPLHLACAVPELPVFALVRDKPQFWNGSSWKANHVWYCRYEDFPLRAVSMLEELKKAKLRKFDDPRIVQVFNAMRPAVEMTPPDPHWQMLPIGKGIMGRLGPDEHDQHPYLVDALKMGIQAASPIGWVCLSRPGLQLSKDISDKLMLQSPCYAYRLKSQNGATEFSPIIDLVCAKADWWFARLGKLPNLFLNHDYYWSSVLWAILKAEGAKDVTGVCEREATPPKGPVENLSPSQTANASAESAVFQTLKMTSRYPKASEQLPTLPLNADVLPAFSYNPSIGKFNGRTVMTYRYHLGGKNTRLGIATLKDGRLEDPKDIPLEGHSLEDARLFQFHGEPWVSWVESDIGKESEPHCIVKYGKVEHGPKISDIHQVKVGANDGRHMEKNWCFFESDENLFCVYRADKDYTVLQIQGDTIINEYKGPAALWPYGAIRGGCIVTSDDKLLRFFHSRTETGSSTFESRYFIGALLMERRPPFTVLGVSRKPILYGSEIDNLKVKDRPHHWKANVVFPGGAIEHNGGWLVAVGVNDSQFALSRVTQDDLNF
jgi:predicted GH43/DUF377 family glycosyl hydrolase